MHSFYSILYKLLSSTLLSSSHAEPFLFTPAPSAPAAPPRPPNLTSVPTLLFALQNEWDAVVLETFNLRQQNAQLRQELSHALYKEDAAMRVLARVQKERDEARECVVYLLHLRMWDRVLIHSPLIAGLSPTSRIRWVEAMLRKSRTAVAFIVVPSVAWLGYPRICRFSPKVQAAVPCTIELEASRGQDSDSARYLRCMHT